MIPQTLIFALAGVGGLRRLFLSPEDALAVADHAAVLDWEELRATGDVVGTVQREGVALVPSVISEATAAELRAFILEHRGSLSAVLNERAHDDAPATRFDIRLPLEGPVPKALEEVVGSLRSTLEGLVGNGDFFELAAMVSENGASPQTFHSDTVWDDEPCLFTAFVALQDVTREMGPTLFFPRTHTSEEDHDDLDDDREDFFHNRAPTAALLRCTDASLYDGRLVHGAAQNVAGTRVLFYVTFKRPDAEHLGNDDAHSMLPEVRHRRLTLEDI